MGEVWVPESLATLDLLQVSPPGVGGGLPPGGRRSGASRTNIPYTRVFYLHRHPGHRASRSPVLPRRPFTRSQVPASYLQELLLRYKQATLPSTIWELANEWKGTNTEKFISLSSIWAQLVSYHQEIYILWAISEFRQRQD